MSDTHFDGLSDATPAARTSLHNRWHRFRDFWLRRDALFVFVLSCYASFFGLTATEMEFHEIFVVQTAAEMQDRGDYLVPYFNGELRLTKPPMNYWLTAASARLRGAERPTSLDGRIPSALAGVALVCITVLLGSQLWSRAVGLNAGLILCGTFGLTQLTHSARPDMVYAAFSVAAFLCFVAAWRRHGRSRLSWLGWVFVALAILTKGPQVPALMLGGLAVAWSFHAPSRRSLARIFRPVRGLLVVLALSSWWWIAIRMAVGAQTLADSQLLGSRFLLGFDAWENPAYYYLIWAALLPWFFLFVPMIRTALNFRSSRFTAARTLGLILLLSATVLNFGHDKRMHYLLPLLPLAALLMSLGMRRLFQHLSTRCSVACLRVVVLTIAGIAIAGVVSARALLPEDVHEGHLDVLVAANLLVIVLATGFILRPAHTRRMLVPFGVPAGVQWLSAVAVAFSSSLLINCVLTSNRSHVRRHTADMMAEVPKDAVLVSIGVQPHYIIHYANRRVLSPETVQSFLNMKIDSAYVVADEPAAETLARYGSKRELGRVPDCEGKIDWVLEYWQAGKQPPAP